MFCGQITTDVVIKTMTAYNYANAENGKTIVPHPPPALTKHCIQTSDYGICKTDLPPPFYFGPFDFKFQGYLDKYVMLSNQTLQSLAKLQATLALYIGDNQ